VSNHSYTPFSGCLTPNLRTLRSTLSTLRDELADLKDIHSSTQRTSAQTIASQISQITNLTHQSSLLHTISELQTQLADLTAAQVSLIHSDEEWEQKERESMNVVRDELHRQAGYLRALESTNVKLGAELAALRERQSSIEVLKEEKRGLEGARGVEGPDC